MTTRIIRTAGGYLGQTGDIPTGGRAKRKKRLSLLQTLMMIQGMIADHQGIHSAAVDAELNDIITATLRVCTALDAENAAMERAEGSRPRSPLG